MIFSKKIPVTIIETPTIDETNIGVPRMKWINTSETNGVRYTILEISIISAWFRAFIQNRYPKPLGTIPINAYPANWPQFSEGNVSKRGVLSLILYITYPK